ncbi:MAG: apolipoprotein N-acyltransferase, partial [Candidatus Latescibacteria bacterium]|nr:apolipoprotein N-acyltransferase [Candidatus Latescibacterota bacterium]
MAPSSRRWSLHSRSTGLWLAVLSGILTTVSIPKLDWWPAAWVSLIPVLVAVSSAPRRTPEVGLTFGFVSGLGKVYWMTETLVLYGHLNTPLGVFSMSIVALFVGLYAAVFLILLSRTNWQAVYFPILAAALWTALEWVQSFFLTGFPWELLGYSQYRVLSIIQIARFTGVYGVSFLVVLVNATITMLLLASRDRTKISGHAVVGATSLTALALIGTLGYGFHVLSRERAREAKASPMTVVVVQGSVSQDLKWSEMLVHRTVAIYDSLARQMLPQHPDFIVFPETALTFYPESPAYAALTDQVYRLVDDAAVSLLTGGLGYEPGQ